MNQTGAPRRAGRLGRRRNNRRSGDGSADIIDIESLPEPPACIDLTEGPEVEFVDLTSVNQYTPIVITSSQSDTSTGPGNRRRRRRLPRFRDPDEVNLGTDSDHSDTDLLTPVPFFVPDTPPTASRGEASNERGEPSTAAHNTSILSPEAKSITCPVCMDSERQIRRSGRNLVSTTCGHIFCNECVRSAIQTQHKCPNCRKKLSMKQFHPIFI